MSAKEGAPESRTAGDHTWGVQRTKEKAKTLK